ncbi:MAG: hypothetical protein HQL87_05270, partial [Magnetococcales bacterium]|nr:hypothetical protein [Magnetococcales bacterium]
VDFGTLPVTMKAGKLGIAANQAGGTLNQVANKTVLDWSAQPLTIQVTDTDSVVLNYSAARGQFVTVSSDVTLDIGHYIHVSGSFDFSSSAERQVTLSDGTTHAMSLTTIAGDKVSLWFGTGDAAVTGSVGLLVSDAQFALVVAHEDSGTGPGYYYALTAHSSSVVLQGVPGLTLESGGVTVALNGAASGSTVIDFTKGDLDGDGDTDGHTTVQVGNGTLDLVAKTAFLRAEGDLTLGFAVSSLAFAIGGHFTFDMEQDRVLVGGSELQSTLTINSLNVGVYDGSLGLELLANGGGFALHADGLALLQLVPGVDLIGGVSIDINQTGAAVDQVVTVGTGTVHLLFANGDATPHLALTQGVDLSLGGQLGQEIYNLASSISRLDASVASSTLGQTLPVLNQSLDDLLGVSQVMGIGDVVMAYLEPSIDATTPLSVRDLPTLNGLLAYLKSHWLTGVPGSGDGLGLDFVRTDTGLTLSYQKTTSFADQVQLGFGAGFDNLGLKLNGNLKADLEVTSTVNFNLAVQWDHWSTQFALNTLSFNAQLNADDLLLGATLGPLGLSLGETGKALGSVDATLGGAISLVQGAFQFTPGTNQINVNLPFYATVAGASLAGTGGQPCILMSGNPFAAGGLSFSADHFDQLVSLSNFSVADLLVVLPSILDYLGTLDTSSTVLAKLPFIDQSVNQFLDLAATFNRTVVEKIDYSNVHTLQDFVVALNHSGLLPAGEQASFDAVTGQLRLPMTFAETLAPVDTPIDLGLDFGSALSLSTDAHASVTASLSGGLDLILDLNGADDKSGLELAVDNLGLSAAIGVDVTDLGVTLGIGSLGLRAGGAGSGSALHLAAEAALVLDRDAPGTVVAGDRFFTQAQLLSGAAVNDLRFSVGGDASAVLKGLTLLGNMGATLPIAPNAEVAVYVQNLLDYSTVRVIQQDPTVPFVLADYDTSHPTDSQAVIAVLPNLGDAFNVSNLSFLDILNGISAGLTFLDTSLEGQSFYTQTLPVVNKSIKDLMNVTDTLLGDLEQAAGNPNVFFQNMEGIIEQALGIHDNNTLPPEQQQFALILNGNELDIHLNLTETYSNQFNVALDFNALLAMAGQNDPNNAASAALAALGNAVNVSGTGKVDLELLANLTLDMGIVLPTTIGTIGDANLFLYDYKPATGTTPASGTHIELGARLAGTNLELRFGAGSLAVGVTNGYIVLDADGKPDTTDPAALLLTLDQKASATSVIDDGKFHPGTENLADNLNVALVGAMDINLPVAVFASGNTYPLDAPIRIQTNPV